MNFPVDERLPVVGNKNMGATTPHVLAVRQVVSERCHYGVVQRHQTGFLELGFANQQTVGGDVGDQQMNASEIRSPVAANKLMSTA